MSKPKLTDAELNELIDRDPVATVCYLLAEASCLLTPHGAKVPETKLRCSTRHAAEEHLLKATGLLP